MDTESAKSPEEMKIALETMNMELNAFKRTNPEAYLDLLNTLNAIIEGLNAELE